MPTSCPVKWRHYLFLSLIVSCKIASLFLITYSTHCVQLFFHFSVAFAFSSSLRELYLIEFLATRLRNLKSAFRG